MESSTKCNLTELTGTNYARARSNVLIFWPGLGTLRVDLPARDLECGVWTRSQDRTSDPGAGLVLLLVQPIANDVRGSYDIRKPRTDSELSEATFKLAPSARTKSGENRVNCNKTLPAYMSFEWPFQCFLGFSTLPNEGSAVRHSRVCSFMQVRPFFLSA